MPDNLSTPRKVRVPKGLHTLRADAARAEDRLRKLSKDAGPIRFDSGGKRPGAAANLARFGETPKPVQTAELSRFGPKGLSRISERAQRRRARLDQPDLEHRMSPPRERGLAQRGSLGARPRPQSEAQRAQAETARNTRAMLALMQNRPAQGWQ